MCLQSKWIFPRKTKQDIIVYKEVLLSSNGMITSPFFCDYIIGKLENLPITMIPKGYFRNFIINNILYIKHLIKSKILRNRYSTVLLNNIYGHNLKEQLKRKHGGYIHAYTDPSFFSFIPYLVIKAKIPKGTLYHISEDGKQICARKLILLERV